MRIEGLPFRHKLNIFTVSELINGCDEVCLANLTLARQLGNQTS
jgi:hypothetical protein